MFFLQMAKQLIIFFSIFWINYLDVQDFNKPPKAPKILLKGLLSTGLNERDLAISPDGNEIFYTIVSPLNSFSAIFTSKKLKNGTWSLPTTASFSGHYPDLEPAFSPDGKKLFFVSKRPFDATEKKDFDIWYLKKEAKGWGTAVHLGPEINSSSDEFYPSIAKNGNLYFTASYSEAESKEDIFIAKFENNTYSKPVALDSAINSKLYEFNAFIAPNESYILFTAYGRKGDMGRGDIYLSIKKDGVWLAAKPIEAINSDRLDYCPTVSSDQKTLYFTSEKNNLPKQFLTKQTKYKDFQEIQKAPQNGSGDIYWVDFQEILSKFKL